MALDEARVDSRQCFLKSSPIMPFYLRTCVDTYAISDTNRFIRRLSPNSRLPIPVVPSSYD